jgi:hypothetical protein
MSTPKYRATHSEEIKAARREHYQQNRKAILATQRAYVLKKKFGLTPEAYAALWDSQGQVCACCGSDTSGGRGAFHVDHDHVTGLVRGILCNSCNLGIGHLSDTLDGVRQAVAYLERHLHSTQTDAPIQIKTGTVRMG